MFPPIFRIEILEIRAFLCAPGSKGLKTFVSQSLIECTTTMAAKSCNLLCQVIYVPQAHR